MVEEQSGTAFCRMAVEQGCQVGILRPNSRNLAFFEVVERMMFGMCVIVWHFLAIFDGVGMEKTFLVFFETSSSGTAVGLELKNFFLGQRSPFFATVPFSKTQAALPSKWCHRAIDVM